MDRLARVKLGNERIRPPVSISPIGWDPRQRSPERLKPVSFTIIAAAILAVGAGCSNKEASTATSTTPLAASSASSATPAPAAPPGRVTVAFVTNNASDYWTIARRGTEQ